jgi:hypothetical protein
MAKHSQQADYERRLEAMQTNFEQLKAENRALRESNQDLQCSIENALRAEKTALRDQLTELHAQSIAKLDRLVADVSNFALDERHCTIENILAGKKPHSFTLFLDYAEMLHSLKKLITLSTRYQQELRDDAAFVDQCVICQCALKVGEFKSCLSGCGHVFHTTCIERCVQVDARCPVCRKAVAKILPTNN